jgi:molecular chaperone HscB
MTPKPTLTLQSNDFALFGLPQQFAQERSAIDSAWKSLQAQTHPDKFAAQGAAAQRLAMQWSVRINEAYQRLKDPLKRAAYLCSLAGVAIDAERNTTMPTDFLMQQMQWREALDEAGRAESALQALHDEARAWQNAALQRCAQLLDTAQDAPQAAGLVRQLLFVEKFLHEVENRFPI